MNGARFHPPLGRRRRWGLLSPLPYSYLQIAGGVAEGYDERVFCVGGAGEILSLYGGLRDRHARWAWKRRFDGAGDHVGNLLGGIERVGFGYRVQRLHHHGGGCHIGKRTGETDFNPP